MTASVVFLPAADSDIDRIFQDLCVNAGLAVGSDYLERFERLADDIALFPNSGALRPELGAGIRIGIVSPYLMIYATGDDNTVRVLRVVHGSQNITSRLLSRAEQAE